MNIEGAIKRLLASEEELSWSQRVAIADLLESQQKTIIRLAKAINDDVNYGVKLDLWSKAFIESESILK